MGDDLYPVILKKTAGCKDVFCTRLAGFSVESVHETRLSVVTDVATM